jgi:hypothetical protein
MLNLDKVVIKGRSPEIIVEMKFLQQISRVSGDIFKLS